MADPVARASPRGGRRRGRKRAPSGSLAKITIFMFLILVPLAALTWWISVQALRANLTEEFTSKGSAIAKGLANSGVDLILTRDASTVQAQVDQVAGITGVAYVMVYDPHRTLIAHTFAPFVPPGLVDQNMVPGDWPQKVQDVTFKDPAGGSDRDVIDIAVPVLAGQLGTVRVGMDRSIITAAAAPGRPEPPPDLRGVRGGRGAGRRWSSPGASPTRHPAGEDRRAGR